MVSVLRSCLAAAGDWIGARAEAGFDPSRLGEEKLRRGRVFTLVSAATILVGALFVVPYWRLGLHDLALAVAGTCAVGVINVVHVRRSLRVRRAGMINTFLFLVILIIDNLSTGGFYDPNFSWLYVVPVFAALVVDARAGWLFTAIVLAVSVGFWLAPELGVEIPNHIPEGDRGQQALFNRTTAVLVLGAILGGLASQERFAHRLLERANDELRLEIERRKEMQETIVRTERLASMGTLAAGVGHEINNPITYVIGNLEAAREEARASEATGGDLLEALDEALEGAWRVHELVGDLKTFARDDRGDVEVSTVRVSESVATALRLTSYLLRQHAVTRVEIDGEPHVAVEPSRLEQVLVNLFTNAGHAMADKAGAANELRIRAREVGEWVEIEIRDTGVGIASEIRARIFEPYFTTKGPALGTGMGLSISRNLIRRSGGELEIVSTGPDGTAFRIRLPRAEPSADRGPVAALSSSTKELALSAEACSSRILIIDDEAAVLRSLKRMLRRHEVVTCADASRALELCKEERFSLILCDVMMPGWDGRRFYEELLAVDPDAAQRVVFMTGGAYLEDLEAFVSERDVRILDKPLESGALEELLEEARARSRG